MKLTPFPRLHSLNTSTNRHPSPVSTTATTPSHVATALHRASSIYQRVSSKVLASAGSRARLRNLRRVEELSTAPKTWKCRLLDPRPAGRGERTGVLGRGFHFPLLRVLGASCQRHGSSISGAVLPGERGRRAISPVFCHRRLAFSPPVAVSKEPRLLCRPEAWEGGNPAHRRGHALVMLCCVVLYTDLPQVEAVPRSWPMMRRLPPNQTRRLRNRV